MSVKSWTSFCKAHCNILLGKNTHKLFSFYCPLIDQEEENSSRLVLVPQQQLLLRSLGFVAYLLALCTVLEQNETCVVTLKKHLTSQICK